MRCFPGVGRSRSGFLPQVERPSPVRLRKRLSLRRAICNRRPTPGLTRCGVQLNAMLRHPGGVLNVLSRILQMPHQADQGTVPADARCSRPIVWPELVIDDRFVLQLDARATVVATNANGDPADLAAELPGSFDQLRLAAARDDAAGVALKLVSASPAQVSGYRQEPLWQTLRVRKRVPDFFDRRGYGTGDDHRLAPLAIPGARCDVTLYLRKVGSKVELHG